jgi:hypothetical protein
LTVQAPAGAFAGTFATQFTVPATAFFVRSFIAVAPWLNVAAQSAPLGRTVAATITPSPATTVLGATRTRTAVSTPPAFAAPTINATNTTAAK